MPMDSLLAGARRLWENLAGAPVTLPPRGGVNVVASQESGMRPAGWGGVVALGGSAIVTVPSDSPAGIVRDALRALPVEAVVDAASVRTVLPVTRVRGPAVLSYLSPERCWPVHSGALTVEQLPTGTPELKSLEQAAGLEYADEAALDEITSPAFAVREHGQVVAAAGYRAWPCRTAHVSVLTAPQARGRGLARATGSATVAHALAAATMARPASALPARCGGTGL